jgi:DNA-binding NarL/FixJ family response regulator
VEEEILRLYPDVVLMDIDMPNVNGIEGLKKLKKISPDTQVIMLTIFEDNEHIFEAICEGASGYIFKRHTAFKMPGRHHRCVPRWRANDCFDRKKSAALILRAE